MNTRNKIERCLKAAPKPSASDDLLDKLQKDINLGNVKTWWSALHKWFSPTGGPVSLWRVATAAVIAIAVLLPLGYGAARAIKYFTVFEATFEYPDDNTMYGVSTTVTAKGDTNINTVDDAKKATEEFYKLYKEGKAREVESGVWVVTLSNGEEFAYGGDPDQLGLTEAERKELLKKQFDEINELKKAGKYEKTYKPEHDYVNNGIKYRYFEARYVLSDGTVKTLGDSEPVLEDDKNKD